MTRRHSKNQTLCSFQLLEKRNLLATIAVTTFDDVVDASDGLTSLREAVTQSNSNSEADTIVLGEGTYQLAIAGIGEDDNATGDLDILADSGNQLSIVGAGSSLTVVDANALDRVFESHIGTTLSMQGFTVTNGSASDYSTGFERRGGGLSSLFTDLSLEDMIFTANNARNAGSGGGALYVAGGNFEISNSSFTENRAGRDGHALMVRKSVGELTRVNIAENGSFFRETSTVAATDSRLTFSRSKIDNNTSAGIKMNRGQLIANNIRMYNNYAGPLTSGIQLNDAVLRMENGRIVRHGKGIAGDGPFAKATISGSTFIVNRFEIDFRGLELVVSDSDFMENGNGIRAYQTSDHHDFDFVTQLSDLRFSDQSSLIDSVTGRDTYISNITTTGLGPAFNAIAVRAEGTNVEIRNVDIPSINSLGIMASGRESVAILDSRINDAAGVEVGGTGDILIENTEITNNFSSSQRRGGAIAWTPLADSTLTISNSLIASNSGFDGKGGILRRQSYSDATNTTVKILSSTIINNRANEDPLFNSYQGVQYEIHNSILWNNYSPAAVAGGLFSEPGEGSNTFDATHNIVSDEDPNDDEYFFDPSLGNLDDNPRFVDFSNNDFRLRSVSPAVDAGDSMQLNVDVFDLNNNGDVSEAAPDLDLMDRIVGSTTDIGAFEFS